VVADGGSRAGYAPVSPSRAGSPRPRPDGHLVKARYTPLQAVVAGADEQGSPHHETLADADSLAGIPVVTADLHSVLPAVCVAAAADRPGSGWPS